MWLLIFISILSLLPIPLVIGFLPSDYWLRGKRKKPHFLLVIILNTIALFFLIVGVVLLFLPGQGLVCILIGAIIGSFPGKERLLASLIKRKSLRRFLDKTRRIMRRDPFQWPEHQTESQNL